MTKIKKSLKSLFQHKFQAIIFLFATAILLSLCTTFYLIYTFHQEKAFLDYLKDQKISYVEVVRREGDSLQHLRTGQYTELTQQDEEKISSAILTDKYPIYFEDERSIYNLLKINFHQNISYSDELGKIVVIEDFKKAIPEDIIGRYPEEEDEILISNFLADVILENGILLYDKELYHPTSYEEIIREENSYYFGTSRTIKIVGIIPYTKEGSYHDQTILEAERINKIFVLPTFLNPQKIDYNQKLTNRYTYQFINDYLYSGTFSLLSLEHTTEYFDGTEWKEIDTLNEDEVILNIYQFMNYEESLDYQKMVNEYLSSHPEEEEEMVRKRFAEEFFQSIQLNEKIGDEIQLKIFKGSELVEEYSLKIAGVVIKTTSLEDSNIYLPATVAEKYKGDDSIKIGYYVPIQKNQLEEIYKEFPLQDDLHMDTLYLSQNMIVDLENLEIYRTASMIAIPILLIFILWILYCLMKQVSKEEYFSSMSAIAVLISGILSILFLPLTIRFVGGLVLYSHFSLLKMDIMDYFLLILLLDILFCLLDMFFKKKKKVQK